MSTSNFGSAIKTGTGLGNGPDSGFVVLSQAAVVNFVLEAAAGSDNVDVYLDLPPGSQIHQINVDITVAWNSVTSASLTVGNAAGGAQYVTAADAKTGGRVAQTPTIAQLLAMSDITTNTRVYIRVAQAGNTSAGQAVVTAVYSQKY